MSFSLAIPTSTANAPLQLKVEVGEMLFILGANGTGKSSLMQAFSSVSRERTRRISAHRQTWFRSGSPEFTGRQRADFERQHTNFDAQDRARWMDDLAEQRAQIVSTHEPLLPVDNPFAKVLLTRACVYDGDKVISYDTDLLEKTDAIDDDLKRTILGERRKIVFVEGIEHSLDKPLYSLLFPNASIVAKSNCREVENAVSGIKGAAELHWVQPFGLVDNDASDPMRIAGLQAKGVIALNVYSVESIYYHPTVQKLAGEKLAELLGGVVEENLRKAHADAMNAIRDSAKHLSTRIAEKAARALVFSLLPKKGEIGAGCKRTLEVDFGKIVQEEEARLELLVNASDFVGVLQRYPIRETPALDVIAKALGFTNRSQYESAVRKRLAEDSEAVDRVRELIGSLPAELIS